MKDRVFGEVINGHFCWNCITQVDHSMQSKDNPRKTELCLYCDHRMEGINSTALVCNWLNLGKSK